MVTLALTGISQLPRLSSSVSNARLQRMFTAHYSLVWRVVRRLGVPEHAADDAAQQVFLVATERLGDIREGSERAFLYGTALRVARSSRRQGRREPATETADQQAGVEPSPEQLADRDQTRRMLDAVLDSLTEELRAVFVLHELEQLTMREIADVLDVPQGTVASRLKRARETFRERAAALFGGAS